ncbi:hypothetical protein ABIB25_004320 [Nakamurella sp. UYEF19]|uniref:hypothetical protein n=1 Tax=Nakamurella sp. UYEF19 TaxID=1756392 RepID=UPI003397AA62
MLEVIFDAGFDPLLPGRAGERSRARRAAKTLDEFERAGTVTCPGAIRTPMAMTNGYVTLRADSIVFTKVSGSKMTHTDIDWTDLLCFSSVSNKFKHERDLSKWWTLVHLVYPAHEAVLACAPNGRTALLKVLVDRGIRQLGP